MLNILLHNYQQYRMEIYKLLDISYENILVAATNALNRKEMDLFDPVVGDTSCEIRALFMAKYMQKQDDSDFFALIFLLGLAYTNPKDEYGFASDPAGGHNNSYYFQNNIEQIFHKKISQKKVRRLIKYIQNAISYRSVVFAVEEANNYPDLQNFLQDNIVFDERAADLKKPILPCFGLGLLLLHLVDKYHFTLEVRKFFTPEKQLFFPGNSVIIVEIKGDFATNYLDFSHHFIIDATRETQYHKLDLKPKFENHPNIKTIWDNAVNEKSIFFNDHIRIK